MRNLTSAERWLSWIRQAGALLLGTFLVGAIVFAKHKNLLYGRRLHVCFNCHLPKLEGLLGPMQNVSFKSIKIRDIDQDVPEQLLVSHLDDLIERETASASFRSMGSDKGRDIASEWCRTLAQEGPWFLQVLSGGKTFNEKRQGVSCGVSAVCQQEEKIDCLGRSTVCFDRKIFGLERNRNGSSLTQYIVLARQISLPASHSGSQSSGNGGGDGRIYQVIIQPMAGLLLGLGLLCFGTWHSILGFGTRSFRGWVIAIALFILGMVLTALSTTGPPLYLLSTSPPPMGSTPQHRAIAALKISVLF
jgi:hypothetical protein